MVRRVVVAVVLGGTRVERRRGSLLGRCSESRSVPCSTRAQGVELKLPGDASLQFQIAHLRYQVFRGMLLLGTWLGRR